MNSKKKIFITGTAGFIGFMSAILDKEHKKFIKTITTKAYGNEIMDDFTVQEWRGDCEVVE